MASNYGTTPWNKVGQSKGFSTSVGLALCFRGPWRPFHTPFVWHKCQVRVQWCVMPKPYRGHRKVQRVCHSKWKQTSPETRSAKVTRSTRCVIRLLSVTAGIARCFVGHARSCKRLYASSKLPSEIDFLTRKCSKTIQITFLNSPFPVLLGVASVASVASWHPDTATSGRAVRATPSRDSDWTPMDPSRC